MDSGQVLQNINVGIEHQNSEINNIISRRLIFALQKGKAESESNSLGELDKGIVFSNAELSACGSKKCLLKFN